jgi:1-phosphofructokinase family hexose kinase
MILTLTPNAAIDRVIFVRGFRLGRKTGAMAEAFAPAGKGVGASLTVHELGGDTLALGLAAGRNGQRLRGMLEDLGIQHEFVDAQGETRVSVVLVDLDAHRQSTINVASLRARPAHLDALLGSLSRHSAAAWGVVFGGSLPPGLPSSAYASLVRKARALGLYTLLDTSGAPLSAGIASLPHVLKVNEDEVRGLEPSLAAHPPDEKADLDVLKRRLHARIGEWASDAVIVTLGHHGTLAVTVDGMFVVRPPEVSVVNTAGAGDAMAGGLMLARSRGSGWTDALALGTAAAASAVTTRGTGVCLRAQVAELLPQVVVEA